MSSVEETVMARYAEGAIQREESLCCPVDYDSSLLKLLPDEIIDKDYGCGDPSGYVREGDVVLDLGSGGGKICYMTAQLVGEGGRVIGVDMTDEMLELARKYQAEMAQKLGSDRVEFKKGFIQDLALDVDAMEAYLEANPVRSSDDLLRLDEWKSAQRTSRPLIGSNSIDLVISNCVLNLVANADRQQLIEEIFRVLRPGGRVAISDIISDEKVPQALQQDPVLWSGCLSGAFQEKEFLDAFLGAGFVTVGYDKWEPQPWQVVDDIEFRSVVLMAVKPSASDCMDTGQSVIYKGPYSQVEDDEGHVFPRGERMAVCERTFTFLTEGPHQSDFIGINPKTPKPAVNFCVPAGTVRPVRETRGGSQIVSGSETCCAPGDSDCC
jgi:SAM-dependent methyltransferase|tara:strand:- start:1926 stop:3068 length:1143 start_codon:yes stop_codon:yes gene_type:complete